MGVKKEGVEFDQLGDVVVIKNYQNENNKIENIEFFDGSTLLLEPPKLGTDGRDRLDFSSENSPLNIRALGGAGNDTYVYNLGDSGVGRGWGYYFR